MIDDFMKWLEDEYNKSKPVRIELHCLPESGYERIKNNMYYGPLYLRIDEALINYDSDEKLVSDLKNIFLDILGSEDHLIGKRAFLYCYKCVESTIHSPIIVDEFSLYSIMSRAIDNIEK